MLKWKSSTSFAQYGLLGGPKFLLCMLYCLGPSITQWSTSKRTSSSHAERQPLCMHTQWHSLYYPLTPSICSVLHYWDASQKYTHTAHLVPHHSPRVPVVSISPALYHFSSTLPVGEEQLVCKHILLSGSRHAHITHAVYTCACVTNLCVAMYHSLWCARWTICGGIRSHLYLQLFCYQSNTQCNWTVATYWLIYYI